MGDEFDQYKRTQPAQDDEFAQYRRGATAQTAEESAPDASNNSFFGGFGRRAWDTAKGMAGFSNILPNELSVKGIVEAPMWTGGIPLLRSNAGYASSAKTAMGQAVDQFRRGETARGIVTGASVLDPLATGPVANINRLQDEGRGAEAAGQGTFDAATMLPGLRPLRSFNTRLPSPLGDVMTRPRGTTPPEMGSPLELLQYAERNNIPANAAQITEHNLPRNLQSVGERATIGGTKVRQQVQAARAGVAQHVEQLAQQMSPGTRTTADAGAALKQGIEAAKTRELQASQKLFQDVDHQARGVMVDFRPVKQLADSIFSDSDFIRSNAKSMDPKRATAILNDIRKLPDHGTFGQAQQLRSSLFGESSHPDNVISEEAQAWIKRLTGATDDQMMTGAARNPQLEQTFRRANEHWRQLEDDFNSPRSPLYQTLKEPVPEKIPQKFLQRGSTGGSPSVMQMLRRYGIDAGPLKRELLLDLAEGNFKIKGNSLGGYDHDFLSALYRPDELNAVYSTGALGRSAHVNVNPSGTSLVMGAMEDVRSAVRTLMPKSLAATITNSPRFNEFLMRAPGARAPARVSMAGPGAAAATSAGRNEDEFARFVRSLP